MTTSRTRFAFLIIAVAALFSVALLANSAQAAAGGVDGTVHKPKILAAGAVRVHSRLDFAIAVTDANQVRLRYAGHAYDAVRMGKVAADSDAIQWLVRTPRRFHNGECYRFTVIAANPSGTISWSGGSKGNRSTAGYCR